MYYLLLENKFLEHSVSHNENIAKSILKVKWCMSINQHPDFYDRLKQIPVLIC